jgi:transcription elongation factor Elf1
MPHPTCVHETKVYKIRKPRDLWRAKYQVICTKCGNTRKFNTRDAAEAISRQANMTQAWIDLEYDNRATLLKEDNERRGSE